MHFYFIGVTTGQSAIAHLLPMWEHAFAVKLKLIGIDLPINAQGNQYQKAVLDFKNDQEAIGCTITSHKLKIFEHASHLFDDFDNLAKLTKEICVITKQDSKIIGSYLPDCLANTLSLKSMLGDNYWDAHNSDVLCIGAGGVARSIVLSLLYDFEYNPSLFKKRTVIPGKIVLIDNDEQQLESIKSLFTPLKGAAQIEYIHHTKSIDNDQLLAKLPTGSLIINATGMGKDIPGSPLTDNAKFPLKSIVWDLNYRGDKLFLKQGHKQKVDRNLQLHDGWECFLHNWTQALCLALGQKYTDEKFLQLSEIAKTFRATIVT